MWEGDLEIGQEDLDGFRKGERLAVSLSTQQLSINNVTTFDWTPDITTARFTRYPRSSLKKKHDLKQFIKNSHILHLSSQYSILSSSLLKILDKKTVGFLEPVTESSFSFTPLIVIMTLNSLGNTILIAFCVDNPQLNLDKQQQYSTFLKLLKENIKYAIVKKVVKEMNEEDKAEENEQTSPKSSPSKSALSAETESKTISMIKEKIQTILPSSKLKQDLSVCSLMIKNIATWETIFKEQKISYKVLFVHQNSAKEFMIFLSENLRNHNFLEGEEILLEKSMEQALRMSFKHGINEDIQEVRNLSSLEQYFFQMGTEECFMSLLINAEDMTNLFEQFETKHNCRILVIPKLEEQSYIYCSVDPVETINRVVRGQEKAEQFRQDPWNKKKFSLVRKHHNPDEIIDGRPKWSEICVSRIESSCYKDDIKREELLDFDRLNPHRTFVSEFEDEFDNSDWRLNHTVLKMLADLNSETAVVLGDNRLSQDLDKKYMEEYLEWQKYKRENKHTYPHVRLKRLKADKLVKIKQFQIIAKNLRKNNIHCNSLYI